MTTTKQTPFTVIPSDSIVGRALTALQNEEDRLTWLLGEWDKSNDMQKHSGMYELTGTRGLFNAICISVKKCANGWVVRPTSSLKRNISYGTWGRDIWDVFCTAVAKANGSEVAVALDGPGNAYDAV